MYGEHGTKAAGRWFFQRVYDDERIDRLVDRTPLVSVIRKENLSVNSSWLYRFYSRAAPASLPLGPLVALTQHTVPGMPGLMLLTLLRLERENDAPGPA